jgi:excisionase family DNA binding protein
LRLQPVGAKGSGETAPHRFPQGKEELMEAHEHDPRLLITVEEAARRLSIGRSHAYAFVAGGELRSVRIGRCRRIRVSDLDSFIERLAALEGRRTY